MKNNFQVIALTAADTLWFNELYYRQTEEHFCQLLSNFQSSETIKENLFENEMETLHMYGYGAKGFTLSMVETALIVSKNQVSNKTIADIIELVCRKIPVPDYIDF
jgi:putative hydrolase of the HAD superfamily